MENVNENVNENVAESTNESANESVSKSTNKTENYFTYYIFIFINSIIGFIIAWRFSEIAIDMLASKNIIDFTHIKQMASMVGATIITMAFMFFSMLFKKFFKKFFLSEIFLYIYIGGLTTVINIIIWILTHKYISTFMTNSHIAWKVAEVIAFIIAVVFAFIADKIIVFKSLSLMPNVVFAEFGKFFGARIVTEGINLIIMLIFIDLLHKNEFATKVGASVIVIVVNYLFSKYIIFKKRVVGNEKNN